MRKEFPELGKLPSLWTRSYFASTAGNISQETIQKDIDAQKARLVELRYFGGLTIDETAEVLGISPATVKRAWSMARAWLRSEIDGAKS